MKNNIISVSMIIMIKVLQRSAIAKRIILPETRGDQIRGKCNKTEQTHDVNGIQGNLSDGNTSCYEGNFILKDFSPNGGQVAQIRYKCSGYFRPLRFPEGRWCASWGRHNGDGCYLYVKRNSVEDCQPHLNVTGCQTIVMNYQTAMQIMFTKEDAFSVKFTLIQCADADVPSTTDVESTRVTQTQSVSNGISVGIPLSIAATTLLLALAIGLRHAYRREKRKSQKSLTSVTTSGRSTSITDENAITPYYETGMSSTSRVVYENSERSRLDNQPYIEPEVVPSTSSTKHIETNTSTEPTYTNSQPSSASYYEPVQKNTGSGYLSPIPREFIDGESGYQYPVKESISECGYLELEYRNICTVYYCPISNNG